MEQFQNIFTTSFPLTKNHQKYNQKPWITKGIMRASSKKLSLFRAFLSSKTKAAEHSYKSYRNRLNLIVQKAKKEYYNQLIINNHNNSKKIGQPSIKY